MIEHGSTRQRFGAWVRFYRLQFKWSQAELGEKIGTTKPSISRIEHGKQNLSIDDIEAITRVFGVDEEDLFRPDPPMDTYTLAVAV